MAIFGFQITRTKPKVDPKQSFTQLKRMTVHKPSPLSYFGQYLDMEGT